MDSFGGRDPAGDERVRGVDVGTRWKLMSVCENCGTDVVHVVVHAPEDRVGHRLGGVAARFLVAMDLLDPFEVDHRHDADLQVGVVGDIDRLGDDGAVQALVEEEVGVRLEVFPVGEGAGRRRRRARPPRRRGRSGGSGRSRSRRRSRKSPPASSRRLASWLKWLKRWLPFVGFGLHHLAAFPCGRSDGRRRPR